MVAGGHGTDPRCLAHPVGQLPGLGANHGHAEMGQDREPGADVRDQALAVLETEMGVAPAGVVDDVQEEDVALVGRRKLWKLAGAGDHGDGHARSHEPEAVRFG